VVSGLPPADVDRYLARLGIAERPAPTIEGLRTLHRAHLRAIPFENASILRGESIPLDLASLVDKILVRGRGGFCYELNGLFAALLEDLGFEVKLRGARTYSGEDGLGPPLDHLCLEVPIDGQTWLADVGFGYSFLEPLRWTIDLEQDDPSGRFRLTALPNGDVDVAWLHRDGAWRGHYRIEPGEHRLPDFEAMCEFQRTSTEAPFLSGWMCSRATETGFVSILYRQLIVSDRGAVVERREVTDDAELAALVARWFGV